MRQRMFSSSIPQSQKTGSGALGLSFVIHGVAIAAAIFMATRPYVQSRATSFLPDSLTKDIVWLPIAGAGGGGGGGGNRSAEPPRKAELGGKNQETVPVAKPPSQNATADEPPSPQNLTIPAVTQAADSLTLPGVLDAPLCERIAGIRNEWRRRRERKRTWKWPGIGRRVGARIDCWYRERSVSSWQRRRATARLERSEAAVHGAGDARQG